MCVCSVCNVWCVCVCVCVSVCVCVVRVCSVRVGSVCSVCVSVVFMVHFLDLRYDACMRCSKMLNKMLKDGVYTDHCPKCKRFMTADSTYTEFIMDIMVSFGMVFYGIFLKSCIFRLH